MALVRGLSTNFDLISDFETQNSIPRRSSKKHAIIIAWRHQYFINGWTSLINKKDPRGRTVKTKCFFLFLDTESGFMSFGFVNDSFIVFALNISSIDFSKNS